MPSEMGVQLRYGPMRMPVLDSVGVDENGGEEMAALG